MALSSIGTALVEAFALIGLGFLLRVSRVAGQAEASALSKIVTYTALPALIFLSLHRASLRAEMVAIPAVGLVTGSIVFVIASLVASRRLSLSRGQRAPFVVASFGGNTGFLGYPIASALFGGAGLTYAIMYDIFATVSLVMTIGIIVSVRESEAEPLTVSTLVRDAARFPPVVAAILGVVLNGVPLPGLVVSLLERLSAAAIPVILIAVGLSLRPVVQTSYLLPAGIAAILKLGLSPALALLAGSVVPSGPAHAVTVLQAGMPSMVMTYVLAERYGLDAEFASFLIMSSVCLSFVSLSVLGAAVV